MKALARLGSWQDGLREPSLSLLLVILVLLLFLVSPLAEDGVFSHHAVNGCLLLLAAISFFVVASRGVARVLIVIGFAVMLVMATADLLGSEAEPFHALGNAAGLLFSVTVTCVIAAAVFRAGPVTLHRIQGAVAIYLNIALTFTFLYSEIAVLSPGSFGPASAFLGETKATHEFGKMLYFSLTTLTTTGYGDIVPIHPIARSLASLEAVIGQLFPATLLASLVGLHLNHRGR